MLPLSRLLSIAVSSFFLTALAASATTAPVAYYPAENASVDISAAHHDATVSGNVSQHYGVGKVGSGFHFDGAANYVDFGDWFTFQSFSMGMWIKDNGAQTDGVSVMENHGFTGLIWKISYSASSQKYVYQSGDGATPIAFSLAAGSWHYLAVVRDGTSHTTSVFVDGQSAGSSTGTGDLDYDFIDGLRVGAKVDLSAYWNGEIDELRMFDRAISADEITLQGGNGADIVVPGTSNPFLAGMPAGSTDAGNDSVPAYSPAQVSGLSIAAGQRLQFSVAGAVNNGGSTPTTAPDGDSTFTRAGSNGIAGAAYPINALVGVFLGDTQPDGSAAPANYDAFQVSGGLNYTTLTSPDLAVKQIFFIGDGLTSGGAVQTVVVPAGATRLFLGTSDGFGWYNNSGTFSVHIANLDATSGGTDLGPTGFTVNGSASPGTIASGASMHFAATQGGTPEGLTVRVQATSTPDVEASWTDLADGNGGQMTSAGSGNFVLDSAAYPAGSAISFRAISAAPAKTDSISNVVGPFELHQAQLSIELTTSSTSDPDGRVARIGDTLTYKLTFTNAGDATATNLQVRMIIPHYRKDVSIDPTRQEHQFETADLTISPGGSVVETGETAPDSTPEREIVWDVGNLEGTFQQFVTFSVPVSNLIEVPSTISLNNSYSIASTTHQPPTGADAISSQSPVISIDVRGPIKFTAVPDVTTVAPGGLFSYTFTLQNLGGDFAKYPAIAIDVPDFSRFVSASYLDSRGRPIKTPKNANDPLLIDHANGPSELVLLLPKLKAGASVSLRVTFQAQWVNPLEAPHLSTLDYVAGFIDPTNTAAVKALRTGEDVDDFVSFLLSTDVSVAFTQNDSGQIDLPLAGSLANAPVLNVAKAIGDDTDNPLDDPTYEDSAEDSFINTVTPGHEVTFLLAANNSGLSAADEVFIQDRLPEGAMLVTAGKKPKPLTSSSSPKDLAKAIKAVFSSKAVKKSNGDLTVTLDADGRTLRVGGMHLDPGASVGMTYSVLIPADGSEAPAIGTVLHAGVVTIGSGSLPGTSVGIPTDIPIKVTGTTDLALEVRPGVPRPGISTDVTQTANTLTALYQANPSDAPLQAGASPSAPKTFVPGDQRYYIHYANSGSAAARDVTLTFPIPQHTVFYRATGIAENGKLGPLPNGARLTAPEFLSSEGSVTVTFNRLNAGADGTVMVEVIILPSAVQGSGSFVETSGASIRDGAAALLPNAAVSGTDHLAFAASGRTPLGNGAPVPKLGIEKIVPREVAVGGTFQVKLVLINYGDVPSADDFIEFTIPEGSRFVSAEYGGGLFFPPQTTDPGHLIQFVMASNNGAVTLDQPMRIAPHTSAIVTLTMQATGAAGTTIEDSSASIVASYLGRVFAPASTTRIVAPNPLASPSTATFSAIAGPSFVNLANGTVIVPIGSGQVVVSGGVNLVTDNGSGIVAQGAGNIVASGAGNLIGIQGVAGLGNSNGSAVLAGIANIVAQGGGNIWNGNADGLIGNDGASLIGNDGAGIVGNISSIVASGAGNIVASGAGNFSAANGIVAAGAGNIVASGAGNILTYGGGIVASGAGNLLGGTAAGLIGKKGAGLAISLEGSSAIVATGGGNIVASGAGNIVASGAGN